MYIFIDFNLFICHPHMWSISMAMNTLWSSSQTQEHVTQSCIGNLWRLHHIIQGPLSRDCVLISKVKKKRSWANDKILHVRHLEQLSKACSVVYITTLGITSYFVTPLSAAAEKNNGVNFFNHSKSGEISDRVTSKITWLTC